MPNRLREIVGSFAGQSQESARQLRRLFEAQPEQFCAASAAVLQTSEEFSHGERYIITILATRNWLARLLCNPSITLEQAIRIARAAHEMDTLTDTRLAEVLVQNASGESRAFSEQDEERLANVICAVSKGERILPILIRLGNHPNVQVRAKAVRLTGRLNRNLNFVKKHLSDANERVRANSIEALWGSQIEGSREVLWTAAGDKDNRVVGNALLALYQCGDIQAIDRIVSMSRSADDALRLTAAWVMGQTGDARFAPDLERMLEDGVPQIRTRARQSADTVDELRRRLRSAPRLRVFCTTAVSNGDSGARRIRVAVRSAAGEEWPTVVPTRCVIREGARRIDSYEMLRLPLPRALEIGFVFPGAAVAGEPLTGAVERALQICSRYKRPRDFWDTVWYGRPSVAVGFNPSDLSLAGATGDQVRFGTGTTSLNASNPSGEETPGLARALERLTSAGPPARESRHIMVVTPREMWAEQVSNLGPRAREMNAVIHGISMDGVPQLEDLSLQTGGSFSVASSEEELPGLLECAYMAALAQYEITYKAEPVSDNGAGVEVTIEIYGDEGLGEGGRRLTISASRPVA